MAVTLEDDEAALPRILTHPVNATNAPPVPPRRAPRLGEHSADILAELGYDAETIRMMAEDGVI